MASKSMTTKMALVLAFNIILVSHLTKPAQAQVGISICPRSLLQIGSCAIELLSVVNIGSSGGGVTVDVGAPTGLLPKLTACCSLLRGLTDSQAAACIGVSVGTSVPGLTINDQVNLTSIVRSLCNRLNQ
ncbi:PREDICTED: putative lipid-binding protein AIR1 [Tarenaya hassleriana]|uniref:putative lipid-binding protein AIR1 n=1 Tax=Tarenaya hassleriana TaxID=28532 RepID=UPI00053C5F26|nr:PREDICTED: putative lipid-binding protein AIR1 [Tarenaya hassleriana]